ncbi:MAG: OsmC family protein [Actinomycetota bacterium]
MGEVRLRWTGERIQFVGDTGYGEPVHVGGDLEGPGAKPSDLLPLSLAACTAYDVVEILRKQRQGLRALEAIVTSTQDEDPPWTFRAIHVEWVLRGAVDRNKADRAVQLAEAKYCAVAATIRSVVELSHTVRIEPT